MRTAFAIGWLLLSVSQVDAAAHPPAAMGGELISPLANIGAVGAISIALVLLVTKVIPARDARHAETVEAIEARHAKTIEDIGVRHTNTVEGICNRFAAMMDNSTEQQSKSAEVIRNLTAQCAARGVRQSHEQAPP